MEITNKEGLPEPIVRAVTNDPYLMGSADISVTQLIAPARIRKLKQIHAHEIIEDASDRVWALLGQSVHHIIERAGSPNGEQEVRLYKTVLEKDITIAGQFDLYENNTIYDFKVTSVYAVKGDCKPEWENQLNVLCWLAHHNDYTVNSLKIVAILRDWNKYGLRDRDYPKNKIKVVSVPLWSKEKQDEYIYERIAQHFGDKLPNCTDEERWCVPGKFAVMKNGRKSALRLLDSKNEAESWMQKNGGTHIEERPTVYNRCQDYCQCLPFCEQARDIYEDKIK